MHDKKPNISQMIFNVCLIIMTLSGSSVCITVVYLAIAKMLSNS